MRTALQAFARPPSASLIGRMMRCDAWARGQGGRCPAPPRLRPARPHTYEHACRPRARALGLGLPPPGLRHPPCLSLDRSTNAEMSRLCRFDMQDRDTALHRSRLTTPRRCHVNVARPPVAYLAGAPGGGTTSTTAWSSLSCVCEAGEEAASRGGGREHGAPPAPPHKLATAATTPRRTPTITGGTGAASARKEGAKGRKGDCCSW